MRAPATIYLKDYRPTPFLIQEVELDIDLESEEVARVEARLPVRGNPAGETSSCLVLDVEEVTVESVSVDGELLSGKRGRVDERHLTIDDVPQDFQLPTVSPLHPRQNTKLMGIYPSNCGFFSLCEAEGFRRITPFLDRPDKHAMKWDEDTYGRELDLDEYNIVAVGDFNAGAMENKGLNIFNTKLVLARQDISTDWDFSFIDRTVAHEYFHN